MVPQAQLQHVALVGPLVFVEVVAYVDSRTVVILAPYLLRAYQLAAVVEVQDHAVGLLLQGIYHLA